MPRGKNILIAAIAGSGLVAQAQVTNTSMTTADAFVCTGSPNYEGGADLTGLNFGAAGTLVIAPPASANGEFQSVIKFNLSNGVALFNATYGSNLWTITSLALDFASNYGTGGVQPNNPIFPTINGGQFVIEWLADDDWLEGTGTPNLPTTDGICFNTLPGLLAQPREILATNTYVPPGNNVRVTWPLPLTANLVADVSAGGDVTFRFYAADDQICYLFNSYKYGRGNEPLIHVVAAPLLTILSGALTNGVFCLTGLGYNNATYHVQVATNLAAANWLTIGAVTADGAGAIQFNDTAGIAPQRFYRLSQ
jgi:hypothetical protein